MANVRIDEEVVSFQTELNLPQRMADAEIEGREFYYKGLVTIRWGNDSGAPVLEISSNIYDVGPVFKEAVAELFGPEVMSQLPDSNGTQFELDDVLLRGIEQRIRAAISSS